MSRQAAGCARVQKDEEGGRGDVDHEAEPLVEVGFTDVMKGTDMFVEKTGLEWGPA